MIHPPASKPSLRINLSSWERGRVLVGVSGREGEETFSVESELFMVSFESLL